MESAHQDDENLYKLHDKASLPCRRLTAPLCQQGRQAISRLYLCHACDSLDTARMRRRRWWHPCAVAPHCYQDNAGPKLPPSKPGMLPAGSGFALTMDHCSCWTGITVATQSSFLTSRRRWWKWKHSFLCEKNYEGNLAFVPYEMDLVKFFVLRLGGICEDWRASSPMNVFDLLLIYWMIWKHLNEVAYSMGCPLWTMQMD